MLYTKYGHMINLQINQAVTAASNHVTAFENGRKPEKHCDKG